MLRLNKDSIEIKNKKYNLIIAGIVFFIWLIAVIISYTSLVQHYWVNFIVSIIIGNTLNILFLIGILLILYFVEKKILAKQLETERKESL